MNELPHVDTLDERSQDTTPVDLRALGALVGRVLRREGVSTAAEASLTLVDPDRIAGLNTEFLEGDGSPTDVLSFPIDGPQAVGHKDRSGSDECPPLVGDIVICPAVAAAQSQEHTGSVEDELALLVIHGSLHLLGWDHDDPHERDRMWNRERQLMTELHREPARDPWAERSSMPATDFESEGP